MRKVGRYFIIFITVTSGVQRTTGKRDVEIIFNVSIKNIGFFSFKILPFNKVKGKKGEG